MRHEDGEGRAEKSIALITQRLAGHLAVDVTNTSIPLRCTLTIFPEKNDIVHEKQMTRVDNSIGPHPAFPSPKITAICIFQRPKFD